MVMPQLTDSDRQKVSAAIAAAESKTSGEIVAVATPISDAYHDVALHWALVPLFAVLAWAAWQPTALAWWYNFLFGGWHPDPTLSELLTLLMVFAALKFTIALLILKWMPMPLRLLLTPAATKHRRVRRRAIAIFQAAAAGRTAGKSGILIYLSLAERRAEIIADEAVLKLTDDHTWGEAMHALIEDVRQGRVADGICAAVEQVGAVLSEHFPRSADDRNEIPDKLIEL
jgi:putative membrane protein